MPVSERRHAAIELDRETLGEMLRPVVNPAEIDAIDFVTRGLSSTNYCVALRAGARLQLRVVAGGARVCAKEVEVLARVSSTTPVPDVLFAATSAELPYYVARWLEAEPLDVVLARRGVHGVKGLGEAIGITLAGIHTHRFDREGHLIEGLKVVPWGGEEPAEPAVSGAPEPAGSDYAKLLHGMIFKPDAYRRLGHERAHRLWKRVRAKDATHDWSERHPCLVHFDYNPSNLLVRAGSAGWTVAAVLDWEFAASAGALLDVGNLLRHRVKYPKDFVDGFIAAYAANAAWLPPDWLGRARLLDVSAQIEALSSAHDRPARHATDLELVDAFLSE